MARQQINASELFDPVEVDLWGPKFRLREATRSVEDAVAAKQAEFNALAEQAAPQEKELAELQGRLTELWKTEPGATTKIQILEEEIEAKQEEVKEKSSTMEDALPLLLDMLAILLEPLTQATDPKTGEGLEEPVEVTKAGKAKTGSEMRPKMVTAKEAIETKYEAKEIGISHIQALSEALNKAALEARPT